MTTLCSPWNQGQRDEYPSKALANFLYSSNFSTKEMDDILVEECNNRNTVYVLNSSYRYGNMDMIELFGTPAGRALTVNNKTATELRHGRRTVVGGSSSTISSTTDPQLCPSTIGGLLPGSISSTNISSIKISGNDAISTAGQHHFIESSEFIRFASSKGSGIAPSATTSIAFRNKCSSKPADGSSKPALAHHDQPSRRNNLKMAKFWKLFDEDRLRKASSTERIGDKLRQSRWVARPALEQPETVDKSANDLYSEAAQLLGIKCSLTDSCRCIDCQSQYFDCDDDADAYSEYSDKSYDMEDNLYTNRSYYNDLSTVQTGVPDADTFGSAGIAAINDRLNRNRSTHNGPWDREGSEVPVDDVVNGNECQHYLHSTHNPSSLNLSLDEGQLPANDRSQLPIDTYETEGRTNGSQAVQEAPSDEECAVGIKVA
ncbi:uncharacterized protein LOC126563637 [Anopheles maculipalpis]|uniref:uncharacterized protein LOC126563637 n=1 Tax=Anopheles maculipalpis TaxID=1496333 RepID=UPI0021599230|nr:uncharacterized protein LOC126563637 [Anopheles maculipalpis]